MKTIALLPIILLFCTAGCDQRKREEELQKKEASLNEREQELLLKEKTLEAKEKELSKREHHLDSTEVSVTTQLVNPVLAGTWSVKMTCIQTDCTGSAVGDTKTEQWNFSFQNQAIVVKAFAGEKLVRVYTGSYTGNAVELVEERLNDNKAPSSKIVVRLRIIDDTHLEGQREILRENDCRVVYALQVQK